MRKITAVFFLFFLAEEKNCVCAVAPIRKREKELCVAAQQWIDPPHFFSWVLCVFPFLPLPGSMVEELNVGVVSAARGPDRSAGIGSLLPLQHQLRID